MSDAMALDSVTFEHLPSRTGQSPYPRNKVLSGHVCLQPESRLVNLSSGSNLTPEVQGGLPHIKERIVGCPSSWVKGKDVR